MLLYRVDRSGARARAGRSDANRYGNHDHDGYVADLYSKPYSICCNEHYHIHSYADTHSDSWADADTDTDAHSNTDAHPDADTNPNADAHSNSRAGRLHCCL